MIRLIKSGFLDALYPRGVACALCNEEAIIGGDGLCDSCRGSVLRCTHPTFHEPLDGLSAAFQYVELARGAIHRFKYARGTYLAEYFAKQIPIPAEWQIDCYVPIPLHAKKLRKRGYNQSELLANHLAEMHPAPVRTDLLKRTRNTLSQTALDADARRKNVRGAFSLTADCKDLSIVLVDDVSTTGATLMECAGILKRAGAKRVYALCAACAQP